jgi:HEAT repeat protein
LNGLTNFEEIGRALTHENEETRYQAVNELRQASLPSTVSMLMTAVADRSFRVREEALGAICGFDPEVTFPRLEAMLRNNENAELRTAAIEAFPRYGRRATGHLLILLADADEEIRNFAAVMLGEVMDPDSVEGLIAALADPEENVQHAAAEALGRIADSRALPGLMACLDKSFWIQYPAIIAIGNIGDCVAVPALLGLLDSEMLRSPVVEALGKTGDEDLLPVLVPLLVSCRDSAQRDEVISALVKIQSRLERARGMGPSAAVSEALEKTELVEHLVGSLQSGDLEVKKNAIVALGWLRQARAAEALLGLLPDYELEEHVVASIIAMGKRAAPGLVAALKNSNPAVRSSALRCLGCMEDMEGCRAALGCLEDPEPEVRLQALLAVSNCTSEPAVQEALFKLLGDSDPEILATLIEVLSKTAPERFGPRLLNWLAEGPSGPGQTVAIRVLGRMRFVPAEEALRVMLSADRDETRAEAVAALKLVAGALPPAVVRSALSDPSPRVRRALAASLGGGDTAPGEELFRLLQDRDPQVRATALETLSHSSSMESTAPLIETYLSGDRRVRLAAVHALGNVPDRAAAQFLIELLQEPDADLKRAAVESLARLRDPRSLSGLIVALTDSDWSVRAAAASALGVLGDLRAAPRLIDRLEDDEILVRKEAIAALADLKCREAIRGILPLVHNENLQLEVVNALERIGVDDFDFYTDFLRRANSRLRCLLVELLGRLRDPAALNCLVGVLENDFFTVRCRAARALAELGDPRAVAVLVRSQREDPSEEVRREAALALTKLGTNK